MVMGIEDDTSQFGLNIGYGEVKALFLHHCSGLVARYNFNEK